MGLRMGRERYSLLGQFTKFLPAQHGVPDGRLPAQLFAEPIHGRHGAGMRQALDIVTNPARGNFTLHGRAQRQVANGPAVRYRNVGSAHQGLMDAVPPEGMIRAVGIGRGHK